MNIHEYQAKDLLAAYGAPVAKGVTATTAQDAAAQAKNLSGDVFVVKAQIHAGGRGKGGGIKLVNTLEELHAEADRMLGKPLITPQTGPKGRVVRSVYVVEDTTIATRVLEYRLPGDIETPGRLVAGALTDTLEDGLSMVYSFYDPAETVRGLGTFMVLDHIERARTLGLPYVYLGYWVEGSRKMAYKTRFRPLEALTPEGWRKLPE